jgi:hypothetical protein
VPFPASRLASQICPFLVATGFLLAMASLACAQEHSSRPFGWPTLIAPESLSIVGGDFSVRNRFVSLTQIHALGPEGFDAPGLRVRMQGGGGSYGGDPVWTGKYAAEAMLGYAWWQNNLGGALYGGWAANHHQTKPGTLQHGLEDGPGVLAEGWWKATDTLTLSAWGRYEQPYDAMQGGMMAEQKLSDRWSTLVAGRAGQDDAGEFWVAELGAGYSFTAPFMLVGPHQDQTLRLFGGISGDGDDTDLSVRFEVHLWNRK